MLQARKSVTSGIVLLMIASLFFLLTGTLIGERAHLDSTKALEENMTAQVVFGCVSLLDLIAGALFIYWGAQEIQTRRIQEYEKGRRRIEIPSTELGCKG